MTRNFLFWTGCAFAGGIVWAREVSFPFEFWAGAAVAVLLLARILIRNRYAFVISFLTAILLLSAAYASSYQVVLAGTLPRYDIFGSHIVEAEGIITSEVKLTPTRSRFDLTVSRIKFGGLWQEARGKVLVQIFPNIDLRPGDFIRASGKMQRLFEFFNETRFSYREYLSRQGINWVFRVSKGMPVAILAHDQGNKVLNLILLLRGRLQEVLWLYLPQEEALIMETMLLGTANRIPKNIQELFTRTGTVHILAISGLHVTLMAVLVFILLKTLPVGRKTQYILMIVLLLGYAMLTGGRPSIMRAFLMSSVFLASYLFERESDPLNSLSLSAWIILLVNPLAFFDVGFQLSYVCVLGIIILYPILWQQVEGYSFPSPWIKEQCQAFVFSLSVWLAVVGFIFYYFNLISPVTVFANLLIVPLSSGVLILGTGLLLAGSICPFFAEAFATCLQISLNLMVAVIFGLAQIPGAYFFLSGTPFSAVVTYGVVLALACYYLRKSCRAKQGVPTAGEIQGLH